MTIGENFFRRYQSADYQAIHTLDNTLVSNFRLYLVHFFLGFVFFVRKYGEYLRVQMDDLLFYRVYHFPY